MTTYADLINKNKDNLIIECCIWMIGTTSKDYEESIGNKTRDLYIKA